jgi:ABC-2 type transport system ATP-binding protein
MSNAIEVQAVDKSFGRNVVLQDLSFSVPEGCTFGFLGRNGQGKTTTIRLLLGLLARDAGNVRVARLDPAKDALRVRARVGYLAEDQQMFGWMTVEETIRFVRPFYETWDDGRASTLLRHFDLSARQRVKHLSKGQKVRLGLLLALAHNPRLVILDDPTLGLDPIMRREFMRDVIEQLQGNGCTVFFSSHLLYEIEPVADVVAILDGGRIVRQSTTDELRNAVRQFVVAAEERERLAGLPALLDVRLAGRRVSVIADNADATRARLKDANVAFEENALNLDEIFEAFVAGNRGARERVR